MRQDRSYLVVCEAPSRDFEHPLPQMWLKLKHSGQDNVGYPLALDSRVVPEQGDREIATDGRQARCSVTRTCVHMWVLQKLYRVRNLRVGRLRRIHSRCLRRLCPLPPRLGWRWARNTPALCIVFLSFTSEKLSTGVSSQILHPKQLHISNEFVRVSRAARGKVQTLEDGALTDEYPAPALAQELQPVAPSSWRAAPQQSVRAVVHGGSLCRGDA